MICSKQYICQLIADTFSSAYDIYQHDQWLYLENEHWHWLRDRLCKRICSAERSPVSSIICDWWLLLNSEKFNDNLCWLYNNWRHLHQQIETQNQRLQHTHYSVAVLKTSFKLTASSRPSAPPSGSGSPKWPLAHTVHSKDSLTYLRTY